MLSISSSERAIVSSSSPSPKKPPFDSVCSLSSMGASSEVLAGARLSLLLSSSNSFLRFEISFLSDESSEAIWLRMLFVAALISSSFFTVSCSTAGASSSMAGAFSSTAVAFSSKVSSVAIGSLRSSERGSSAGIEDKSGSGTESKMSASAEGSSISCWTSLSASSISGMSIGISSSSVSSNEMSSTISAEFSSGLAKSELLSSAYDSASGISNASSSFAGMSTAVSSKTGSSISTTLMSWLSSAGAGVSTNDVVLPFSSSIESMIESKSKSSSSCSG